MKANPFVIKRNLEKWFYSLARQSLTEFNNLAKDGDRVIYHVKIMSACFADKFPNKMIRAMAVPVVQQAAIFANPTFSGFSISFF